MDPAAIAWFDGSVDAAFAAARAAAKPVLLYWGAEWCPDCKQLKSSVFTRDDFIARTRQFVPVYLDGDLPGAQAWGDRLRIAGYPTVVVLTADGREVTRVSGGMDLTLYAAALDVALADLKPMAEVLAAAARTDAPLSADDCRRLAYHGYGLDDADTYPEDVRAAALANAARRCTAEPAEQLRLELLTVTTALTGLAPPPGRPGAPAAAPRPDAAGEAALRKLHALLASPEAAARHMDLLNALPGTVFAAARAADPLLGQGLASRIASVAEAAARDPRFAPADQLYAERLGLAAAGALADTGRPPPAAAQAVVNRARKLLGENPPGYVHASLVGPTLMIYADLGDDAAARSLLEAEANASKNAHYYLGNLARIEEGAGNGPAALALYARAWQRAEGTATRAQWGYDYLAALLRLSPDDVATIERTGLTVLDELRSADNVHRRTRSRLEKLGMQLGDWARSPAGAASDGPTRTGVVARLQQRLAGVCATGAGAAAGADDGCATLLTRG